MINFVKLDEFTSLPEKGYYTFSLGKSQDFFDVGRKLDLRGYLFLPEDAKCLIVFQTDIMAVGHQGYALEFGKYMFEKGIAVLTFDNAGSENFGGLSEGTLRDYLPDQMRNDIAEVIKFVTYNPAFSKLKKILGSVSYGSVPVRLAIEEVLPIIDGIFFIGPPENGWEIYEKFYKGRLEEGKAEDGTDVLIYTSKNTGKKRMIPKLFFSKKRILPNVMDLTDAIQNGILPLRTPAKIFYAGDDEILDPPVDPDPAVAVVIEGAQHNFLNVWDQLMNEIIDLCNTVVMEEKLEVD